MYNKMCWNKKQRGIHSEQTIGQVILGIFSQFHWSFCVAFAMDWSIHYFGADAIFFSNVKRSEFKWFSTLSMCEQHASARDATGVTHWFLSE